MAKKSKQTPTDITVRHEGDTVVVTVPVKFYRRNGRQHVIAKDSNPTQSKSSLNKPNLNQALIANIAKALLWQEEFESGKYATLDNLAKDKGVDRSYARRLMNANSLSPNSIARLLKGNEIEISIGDLTSKLDLDWHLQEKQMKR